MALKKDKEKVIGEFFDDERIKSFLEFQPPEGVNADYHLLEKAYRGMIPENFATFVKFFVDEGRDINARGPAGKTMLQIMKTHRLADDYIAVMERHGAE